MPNFLQIVLLAVCYSSLNCQSSFCDLNDCPCDEPEPNANLSFSQPVQEVHSSCSWEMTYLYCCVNGSYDEIIWDYSRTGGSWSPVPLQTGLYYLVDNNQMYVINRPIRGVDDGFFRCTANHNSSHISSVIEYIIRACDDPCHSSDTPCSAIILNPQVDNTSEAVNLGDSVELKCVVQFPRDLRDGFAYGWRWKESGRREQDDVFVWYNNFTNYSNPNHRLMATFSMNDGYGTSDLRIKDIEKADLHSYECVGKTPFTEEKSRRILLKDTSTSPLKGSVKAALVIIVLLFIVVATLLMLAWHYKLDIQLWLKENYKPDKTFPEGMKYDAAIVCSDEESSFVEDILLPGLERCSFTVCYEERDFHYGTSRLKKYTEIIKSSRSMIVVLSPSLLQSEFYELIFELSVIQEYRNMIFIQYEIIDIWPEEQRILEAAISFSKKKVRWIESGLKTGQSSSEKDLDRFWKKLKLVLPKPLSSFTTSERTSLRYSRESSYIA